MGRQDPGSADRAVDMSSVCESSRTAAVELQPDGELDFIGQPDRGCRLAGGSYIVGRGATFLGRQVRSTAGGGRGSDSGRSPAGRR
jgi:hypothetical protein